MHLRILRDVALYSVGKRVFLLGSGQAGRPFICFNKNIYLNYQQRRVLCNAQHEQKGAYKMKTLHLTQFTGRKQRTGSLCFDESGRMCVFVNYCEDCKGKIVLTRSEAEIFAYKYKQITNSRQYKKFERELKKFQII